MKKLYLPLLLILLAASQNSLFVHLKIFGVIPDLVLIFDICVVLAVGNPYGTITAILGGIIVDIFSGAPFGIQSIGYMVSVYLIGAVEGKIYKDNIFVPGIFTFLGSIVKESIVGAFLYLTGAQISFYPYLLKFIIPLAIYNTVLAAIFYRYIGKLMVKLSLNKPGGFNA